MASTFLEAVHVPAAVAPVVAADGPNGSHAAVARLRSIQNPRAAGLSQQTSRQRALRVLSHVWRRRVSAAALAGTDDVGRRAVAEELRPREAAGGARCTREEPPVAA